MASLSGSAFLQALGWAIANSLWQMALMWGLYQLCFSVFRKAAASAKTTAATLSLFGGFVWFLSSLTNHYWQVRASALHPDTLVYIATGPLAGPAGQGHSFRFYINEFLGRTSLYLPYLSFAYLLVLSFLFIRMVKAYKHVRQVRYEGLTKMEARWRIYVQELAHRIGITREVKVWLSEKIDIPATIGYFKPLILVPVASFNHLTTKQVEAILLHELAHIKRHDYLLNLIITIIETVLFFNPFAQLIIRHIKTERENSCDDFVLQFRYNPYEYASALLSLEQQRKVPELAMMASGKTDLLDRVKRIMNVQAKPMNYGQKLFALLITAGILVSLACLTPDPNVAAPEPIAPKPLAWLKTRKAPVMMPDIVQGVSSYPAAPKFHATSRKRAIPAIPPSVRKVPAPGVLNKTWHKTKIAPSKEMDPLPSMQQALLSLAATIDAQMGRQMGQLNISGLDSVHRMLARLIRERDILLSRQKKNLVLLRKDQRLTWDRSLLTYKAAALTFKKNIAEGAGQEAQTDKDKGNMTGVKADQPGGQNQEEDPGETAKNKAGIIPVKYIFNRTIYSYKERITVPYVPKTDARDNSHSSIGYFLQRLAHYGIQPEDRALRITKDGNTLLINDKIQPKAVYTLFKSYFAGESVVIIENGEVVQITIN